jgi:hypothetical protein
LQEELKERMRSQIVSALNTEHRKDEDDNDDGGVVDGWFWFWTPSSSE